MINNLQIAYNAQFYKLKEEIKVLPNKAIKNIIKEACKNRKGRYIIGPTYTRNKINLNGTEFKYTVRVYPATKQVMFFKDTPLEDTIHAYIIILEFDRNIIIFKKSTATFNEVLKQYMRPYFHDEILKVIHAENYSIQRLSLRNMTISASSIHSQTYETSTDLKGILSPYTLGKSIPANIRYKEENTIKSITSSTARILETSKKSNIEGLCLWAKEQVRRINLSNSNYFLKRFAKPIELKEVLNNSIPKGILFEISKIKDLLDNHEITLGIQKKNKFRELSSQLIEKILNCLEESFEINESYTILTNNPIIPIGSLKINEKSLTFTLEILNRIKIKHVNGTIISFTQFIINKKLYSIVFDNIKYMYFMGQCFQDDTGISEIDTILNILYPQPNFEYVKREKGKLSKDSTQFDETSLFYMVEKIHSKDDYIFCDDLGNEWCDHMTFNLKEKTINFIHSKAKNKSLSASYMHDVVSQGIKNLGNMFFTIEDFQNIKKDKFLKNYNGEKVQTNIKRIRKGSLKSEDINKIKDLINNYKTHRQCILSCSFLSKSDLEKEFKKLKEKKKVKGNIIQLLWILSSYIHSCKSMNIIPLIYCRK